MNFGISPIPCDDRPKYGWWAPGYYTCVCRLCNIHFLGDKRAGWCADCAYKRKEEDDILTTRYSITQDEVDALSNIQYRLHGQAKAAGWYDKPREVGTMIALCHSELSEALEGVRKNTFDDHLPNRKTVEVELADTIIRILDLGGYLGLDIAGAIKEKHDYNRTRADHSREARAASGGKQF